MEWPAQPPAGRDYRDYVDLAPDPVSSEVDVLTGSLARTAPAPCLLLGPFHKSLHRRKVLAQDQQAGDHEHPSLHYGEQSSNEPEDYKGDTQGYSEDLFQGGDLQFYQSPLPVRFGRSE